MIKWLIFGVIGSCYAFSAVAAVEGITYIKQRKLVSLSEQEVVDCDKYDNGCNKGSMQNVFSFIQQINGITTESYYPYTSKQGTCQNSATNQAAAKITGFQNVPQNSEADLLNAVANQPVSVAVDSSDYQFRFYSGGVFNAECGTQCDHAITIVGYGANGNGDKYWIVKNSWGTGWGEGGYGYFIRDVADPRGICGIATDASFPTI